MMGFTLILVLSTAVFYCLAVLFGAHPINQLWGNVVWSLFMTMLTCLPLLLTVGSSRRHLSRVLIQCRFSRGLERGVYFGCIAALVGAWVGAFPILLDWRRPWQVWPIPCCVGAGTLFTCYWLSHLILNQFWPHLLAISRAPPL